MARNRRLRAFPCITVVLALLSAASPALAAQASVAAGTISTVDGGVGGPGPATGVGLGVLESCGVSYAAGQVYIADKDTVRQVNPQTDALTTPVGDALDGAPHLGGPAAKASGVGTCSTVTDASGNLIIASGKEQVMMVPHVSGTYYGQAMKAGDIYSIAGTGDEGFSGDGGPAVKAELDRPVSVAVDGVGNVLVSDDVNNRVRVIAARTGVFYGQSMTTGDIYTIAGTGTAGFSGDGGPATAADLDAPSGLTLDASGNVLIADAGNERIRVLAASSGAFYGQSMTAGDLYTIAGDGHQGFSGDGGPATAASFFLLYQAYGYEPVGLAVDGSGNLVVADAANDRIRVVATSNGSFYGQSMTAGDVYTVAGDGSFTYSGDGGPALDAGFYAVQGVAVDGSGNLLIADRQSGRIRAVAARTGTFYGQAMTAGDVYTVAGQGVPPYGGQASGDGGPATESELSYPQGLTTDSAGTVLVADSANNRIQAVAGRTGTFYGQKMTAGDTYTVAGDDEPGYTGDHIKATKAEVNSPRGVAVDGAGNLLIADYGNDRIRVVAGTTGSYYGHSMRAGYIYTIAGGGTMTGTGIPATEAALAQPVAVRVDAAGNVLIENFNKIQVVAASTGTFYQQPMTAGDLYTIAGNGILGFSGDGGPATAAELGDPADIAVDHSGNVLIADSENNRIRVVAESTGEFYGQSMTTGDIYTVAGGPNTGLGDGGPATKAQLGDPTGVAVDSAGNLLIADSFNDRVRVVAASAGTFYGVAMTTGDIYTVAGSGGGHDGGLGKPGFSGDGGPGTSALIDRPIGVAPDGTGLVFSDSDNQRIRLITG